MAETRKDWATDKWFWICRCGIVGPYLPTQDEARADGDRHLAEANAEKEDER
jgi:hypothetical protein